MTLRQIVERLDSHLRAIVPMVSKPQRENLALLVLALAQSPDCHLATLATVLPVEAQRESLVQRLRRFLDNKCMPRTRCYDSLVRHLFAHWQGAEAALLMDRTDLEDRVSILMLGLAYGKRALPLAWHVLPFGGTGAETQITLLRCVAPWIPLGVRVTLFGDCEFRAVNVQAFCQEQGWHWQLGLKSDTYFHEAHQPWQQLKDIPLQPRERHYRQRVWLTQEHLFGPVNLMAAWPAGQDTPTYVALDQRADRHAWRRGRKRQWIENLFRDDKTYGFNLEQTQIDQPQRLDALLMGMGFTYLWMMSLGDYVVTSERRVWLEPRHKRDYSLFQLGRAYLTRGLVMDWEIPIRFTVTH